LRRHRARGAKTFLAASAPCAVMTDVSLAGNMDGVSLAFVT
jgi:hypothetical protein